MNAYEKGKTLKNAIFQLYVNEGRSKSYISRLLGIDRRTLATLINEWGYIQCNQYKKKIERFLSQYKEYIISKTKHGYTRKRICEELHVGQKFLNAIIEYDNEIKDAFQYRSYRDKESIEFIKDEEWKPVLGFEKYYISNYGRVKTDKGFIKSIPNSRNGYLYVSLYNKDGKSMAYKVHRLVAHAFCNGYSDTNNTVNHIDGDITNNKHTNLEWVSQSYNNKHVYDCLNRKKNRSKPIPFIILYKNKYMFKTITSFSKFINKSETQAARWIYESPDSHDIDLIPKHKINLL